ncbi:MAG: VUT family protein [Bacilli bacterium]|nr:VUT family protein [Bacilli bacterium]
MNYVLNLFRQSRSLMRNIPALIVAVFFSSLIAMNLLANKSIDLNSPYIALDAGILFSWVSFFAMDMVIRRFGLKEANILTVVGLLFNLFFALMFFLASLLPGMWSSAYVDGSEAIINTAVNEIFAGTWYVILGSSAAFLVSGICNNLFHFLLRKAFKKDDGKAFYVASVVSSFIGQLIDNMTFALIVSMHFFGWTFIQCVTCALTGAALEVVFEVIFAPLAYRLIKKWEKDGVGKAYLDEYHPAKIEAVGEAK